MKKFTNANSFIIFNGMKLITTPQAMRVLSIEGKPINWRTFRDLVKSEGIEPAYISPQGSKFWDLDKINRLATKLPTKRPRGPVSLIKRLKKEK